MRSEGKVAKPAADDTEGRTSQDLKTKGVSNVSDAKVEAAVSQYSSLATDTHRRCEKRTRRTLTLKQTNNQNKTFKTKQNKTDQKQNKQNKAKQNTRKTNKQTRNTKQTNQNQTY